MLIVENISKSYQTDSQVTALKNVSFKAEKGDFVSITGSSGSGKSTLLSVIGGMMHPESGSVTLDSEKLYEKSNDDIATLRADKIGFIFQQFHLIPYLSVEENILAPTITKKCDNSVQKATELMKRLGIYERRNHKPEQLSTGEQQRTALARALITSPKLLLADEPTGNLDDENSEIVLNELANFSKSQGTVIMVTHDKQAAAKANKHFKMKEGALNE